MVGGIDMKRRKIVLFLITVISAVCVSVVCYGAEQRQASAEYDKSLSTLAMNDYNRATLQASFGASLGREAVSPGQPSDMVRVFSLFETKIGDQRVLSRIRYKLSLLSEERLRTLASLSERIIREGREAQADVAFLLLTTLIIFS